MVLSEYAKIRILTLWRNGSGPTSIVEMLDEGHQDYTEKCDLLHCKVRICICTCFPSTCNVLHTLLIC